MKAQPILSRRSCAALLAGLALSPSMIGAAGAARPARIVTPAAPGSSTDILARLYAEGLSQEWKAPVMVEPVTGANGVLAIEAVLRSGEDTVFFGPAGILTVTPLITPVRFNPESDVTPLALGGIDFLGVACAPSIGVASLEELVALGRKRPGFLNVAAGPGGPYLALMSFLRQRGVDATFVPYKGPPDAMNDLVAGRLHVLVGPLAPVISASSDGRVRIVAITNPERSPLAPGAATARQQGFPELELEGTLGFFVSSRNSREQMAGVSRDIQRVAQNDRLLARAGAVGIVMRSESREAFATRVSDQMIRWRTVASALGPTSK